MSNCPGCGGVIGRDCFNTQECVAITRQMAEQYNQEAQQVQMLQVKYNTLLASHEKLVEALMMAEGYVAKRKVLTRNIIEQALKEAGEIE